LEAFEGIFALLYMLIQLWYVNEFKFDSLEGQILFGGPHRANHLNQAISVRLTKIIIPVDPI